MLTPDEAEDTWAIGCPIGAAYVPDELLVRAIAENRVAWAYSESSMGTATTLWVRVESLERVARWRDELVAWPPGHVVTTDTDDYDDRDVYGVLWRPHYRDVQAIAARAVPAEGCDVVLAEYARVLAALERAWMRGSTERDGLIALLEAEDPIAMRAVLAGRASSTRHLVRGIEARWIKRDVGALLAACIASVERFGRTRRPPITREELRHQLVQVAVRVARGRPSHSVAW